MSKAKDLYGRPWSEPEFIVVLHYHLKHREEPRHQFRPYVQELARIMGRTPASINMRLENFASLDSSVEGGRRGLGHISPLGRDIYRRWAQKPDSLKDCAEVLLREIESSTGSNLFDTDTIKIPRAFGRYELLDLIGDGGFGSVFSCINTETGLPFALKIVRTDRIRDEEIISRFRREIKALKTFQHANVIRLHEDNLDQERHFPAFIMDLAEVSLGGYLEQTLSHESDIEGRRPRLPITDAISLFNVITNAVQAMHSNSPPLIHRDINPNNILRMADGRWVLADFSLAKFRKRAIVSTSFATESRGRGRGTEPYTAPEQWQDFSKADERADIYSLGILIWELFSPAWPPFERGRTMLSDKLEKIILTATDRMREVRYGSVATLREAFAAAF